MLMFASLPVASEPLPMFLFLVKGDEPPITPPVGSDVWLVIPRDRLAVVLDGWQFAALLERASEQKHEEGPPWK